MIKNFSRPAIAAIALAAFALGQFATAQDRRQIPEFRTFGQPASAAQANAIDQLVSDYWAAWGAEDVDRLMALHAEDTEWINAFARIFQGRPALADFVGKRLFPGFDPAVSRQEADNMRVISTRYIGDDAAIVHTYTDSPRGSSRNSEEQRRVHVHLVLAKRGQHWKVVHTVIMDAR